MTLAHVSEIVRRFEADRAAVSYAEWRAWLAAQERRIAIHHIRSKLQAMSTGHRTPVPGFKLDKKTGKPVADQRRLPVNIQLQKRASKAVRIPIIKRTKT
jgi:hypothetical protein